MFQSTYRLPAPHFLSARVTQKVGRYSVSCPKHNVTTPPGDQNQSFRTGTPTHLLSGHCLSYYRPSTDSPKNSPEIGTLSTEISLNAICYKLNTVQNLLRGWTNLTTKVKMQH